MAHYSENKNTKILVSVLRNQQVELEVSINIPSKASNRMLGYSIKKTENDVAKIEKTTLSWDHDHKNDLVKLHPDFSEERKKERLACYVGKLL